MTAEQLRNEIEARQKVLEVKLGIVRGIEQLFSDLAEIRRVAPVEAAECAALLDEQIAAYMSPEQAGRR